MSVTIAVNPLPPTRQETTMCFAKTIAVRYSELYALCDRIDVTCRENMPFEIYQRGCHLISVAAAKIMRNNGFDDARAVMVASPKQTDDVLTPHYVVVAGGSIFDFKRRVFGMRRGGEIIQSGPVYRGHPQPNGWYPDGKSYIMNPTMDTFELPRYKTIYADFARCHSTKELCKPDWYLVKSCVQAM